MKMDKKEYVKWYNLATSTLDDDEVFPVRSESKIIEMVSQQDWILIWPPKINSQEAAKSSHQPNIWFNLSSDKITIGLVFNTLSAMDKILNLFHGFHTKEREQLIDLLHHMKGWSTTLDIKTKKKHFSESPKYEEVVRCKSQELNEADIENIFEMAKKILQEAKAKRLLPKEDSTYVFQEAPVLNLLFITVPKTEAEFIKKLKELLPSYHLCLKIKGDVDIRRKERQQKRKVSVWKCTTCGAIFREKNELGVGSVCPECGKTVQRTQVSIEEIERKV